MNFIVTDRDKQLQEARAAAANKNYPAALRLYGSLCAESASPGVREEYGRTAAAAGDYELADRQWEQVLKAAPPGVPLLSRLAAEYGKIGLFAKARALCVRAAALAPGDLEAQLSLASFLSRTAGIAEARLAVNATLHLDPGNQTARYLGACLDRREDNLPAAETNLRDILAEAPRDPLLAMYCHFELARVLDRIERFDDAMAELAEAKRIAATTFDTAASLKKYEDRRDRALGKTAALPNNILKRWAESFPPADRTPAVPLVCLGGHPRSGTTLLERILDAHPSVAAGDETMAFASISPLIDITAPSMPAGGLNFLRTRYLKNMALATQAPGPGTVIIDKNPAATTHLPAFLRAFPELRVLIALRDPRDVVVSSYFEGLRNVTHFTFERLAEHYCSLMQIWLRVREWEGLNFRETRYEDTVADLAGEGARVTQFIGLQWHENQARFHQGNRQKPVMSSNYGGVTQPVYKRAVGRWMAYEKYLAPVLPVLEPYCQKFGCV